MEEQKNGVIIVNSKIFCTLCTQEIVNIKEEKLRFIDTIITGIQLKLHFTDKNKKDVCCGVNSDDYVKGFNAALSIVNYNLSLERQFVEHGVTCGYDLSKKLKID